MFPDESLQTVLEVAGRTLNRGYTEDALTLFTYIRDEAKKAGEDTVGKAEHMRGICLRMLGRYGEAEVAFEKAFRAAKTRIRKGHIKRDWCMVPLEQGDTVRAHRLIEESLELLRAHPDPEDDRPPKEREQHRRREYFASFGFRCRVYALEGDLERARIGYKVARTQLFGEHPYELNTTVWELKVTSFPGRLRLFGRALYLAYVKSGNKRRCIQILLLTFCQPLGLRFEKN